MRRINIFLLGVLALTLIFTGCNYYKYSQNNKDITTETTMEDELVETKLELSSKLENTKATLQTKKEEKKDRIEVLESWQKLNTEINSIISQ